MGEVLYNNVTVKYDDAYSFKIFGAIDVMLPDNITIYCSNFSHETPSSRPFRVQMKGVTFVNCNLDNCTVPKNCTIIGGTHAVFQAQNDGNDWEIDAEGRPINIMNPWVFAKFGLPQPLPNEIPAERVERIDWLERKRKERNERGTVRCHKCWQCWKYAPVGERGACLVGDLFMCSRECAQEWCRREGVEEAIIWEIEG